MASPSITKRRIARWIFAFACCVLLIITSALCFNLDGQSKTKKPSTYTANYIGRVVNIIVLVGNVITVFKHKLSTQADIRLYSALKQSGMFMLSACVLIYDPMIAASLDENNTMAYGNTAKSLFIASMIITILFFVLSMVVALMKPSGSTKAASTKSTNIV